MALLHRLLSYTLIGVLIITALAMSTARGQARDAAGAIILCTGHGTVLVYLDATGDPIEAPHLCPDCVLQAFGNGPVITGQITLRSRIVALPLPTPAPLRIAQHLSSNARARAPPA